MEFKSIFFPPSQMKNSKKKNELGITLVELAVVLAVIGLLVGGIIRGQELITIARLQATIRQVNSYTASISTFEDIYFGLPGDLSTATTKLPNCNITTSCSNGNGNGIIGVIMTPWVGGTQSINTENTQFWKHLSNGRFITGVVSNTSNVDWGFSHPTASLGVGGFSVVTSNDAEGAIFNGAPVLRWHGDLNSGITESHPVVSPKHAGYIDTKMDDGNPRGGFVRSRARGLGAPVASCEENYEGSREDSFCIMSFVIRM